MAAQLSRVVHPLLTYRTSFNRRFHSMAGRATETPTSRQKGKEAPEMRRILLATLLFTAMSLLPATAGAATFAGTLTQVFSGNVPDSTSPYLSFTFLDGTSCDPDCGAGTVQLILTASLEDADEFVTEWDFNMTTVTPLTFSAMTTLSGTVTAPTITQGSNHEQADGDGLYDLAFFFTSSNAGGGRMAGTDSVSFIITGTGITAQTFNALSAPAGGAGGPFTSAAHIQGITPNCSGWVSTSGPDTDGNSGSCTSVPDGGTTLSLLGLALGGIGVVRRFMRS